MSPVVVAFWLCIVGSFQASMLGSPRLGLGLAVAAIVCLALKIRAEWQDNRWSK